MIAPRQGVVHLADNPGGNREIFARLGALASNVVPLLHVCGSIDPAFDTQTRVVEKRYKALGGSITVIVKEGEGHFPLASRDPEPIVDFIVGKVNEVFQSR